MKKISGKFIKLIPSFSFPMQETECEKEKLCTFVGAMFQPCVEDREKCKDFLISDYVVIGAILSADNSERNVYLGLRFQLCNAGDDITVWPSEFQHSTLQKVMLVDNLWNDVRPYINQIV